MAQSKQTKPTDWWNSDNGREKQRGKQQLFHEWMRPRKDILLCLYNMMPPPVFLQASAQTPRQRRRMRIAVDQAVYPTFNFHCVVRGWQFFAHISHPKRVSHFLSVPIFLPHFLPCECDLSQKCNKCAIASFINLVSSLTYTAPSQTCPAACLFIWLAECLMLELQWNGLFLKGAE